MTDVYRGLFAPVALIGLIHIIGGIAVLVAPQAAYVSQLSGLMMVLPHPTAIAVGLIIVGVMAVTARLTTMAERTRAALIAPQQIVLVIQLMGVGVAAWKGAYPDGYVPVPGNWWASFWFILGDQAALVVLCLSHTFEFTTLKAFRITTPAQYEAQLAKKDAVAAALAEERDTLESRVRERTERLNMVNAELHHRFKNMLSVISALARQSGAEQAFSDVFDKRLRGIAATLDLLTEKHWQGATIGELVKAQLGIFDDNLDVEVSGPDFALMPAAVQPLGMALHELATNTLKHNPRGTQALTWEVFTDGAEPKLRFVWSEMREPAASHAQVDKSGSGRKLLERIVPQSLSGKATLTAAPQRITWLLEAPLSTVGSVIESSQHGG
jgi:two-component sensor histidine kinase